jgi:thiamine kinase-like enzyme
MTASFTSTATTLTIKFEYTGPLQTVYDIANHAAQYLWDATLGPHGIGVEKPGFDALTPEQKLAILDEYIARTFVTLAKEHFVLGRVDAATLAALADAEKTLSI